MGFWRARMFPSAFNLPMAEKWFEQTEWLIVTISIIFVGSSNLSIDRHMAEYVKQTLIFPWLIVLHLYLMHCVCSSGIWNSTGTVELVRLRKMCVSCAERRSCLRVMVLPRDIWFILSLNSFPDLCLVFWFCNVTEHLLLIRKALNVLTWEKQLTQISGNSSILVQSRFSNSQHYLLTKSTQSAVTTFGKSWGWLQGKHM